MRPSPSSPAHVMMRGWGACGTIIGVDEMPLFDIGRARIDGGREKHGMASLSGQRYGSGGRPQAGTGRFGWGYSGLRRGRSVPVITPRQGAYIPSGSGRWRAILRILVENWVIISVTPLTGLPRAPYVCGAHDVAPYNFSTGSIVMAMRRREGALSCDPRDHRAFFRGQ
jgi:hypothetical protein